MRYGRYTLVSTQPDAGQRDLMAQIIDVTIPSSMNPSVKDAMQYVMSRSGYSLCPAEAGHVNILYTRPLPAAQYKLGPMTLRNTLQVIQGWLFESSKCDGRVLVATYHRTGNSTAADLTAASQHLFADRPAFVIDNGNTAALKVDLKVAIGSDEPLQPSEPSCLKDKADDQPGDNSAPSWRGSGDGAASGVAFLEEIHLQRPDQAPGRPDLPGAARCRCPHHQPRNHAQGQPVGLDCHR
ncbi:type 4b pilus protein PilO2, partial [Pseudomonas aeruginosa]|uniref:PFGI-1 class ICE element type IV pilus protein PilL2 n=1 Tax=Pseudomonas aeruginosa TaxID=287 RepID=UPI003BF60F1A